jgi:hypothetical protein
MLPNKPASFAAANNPIRIIFATCSRGRSAAKRATNSPSRYAARITVRSIVPVTNRPGGRGAGVDPVKVARQLWQETRNHPQDGHPVALRRARASAMLDAPLSHRVVSRIFRTFGLAERHPALAHAVMAPLI